MRRLALLLAILVTPLLRAATFRFDPPAPTNAVSTAVTFSGSWPDGCPPSSASVSRDNAQITLSFPHTSQACTAVITFFTVTTDLGVLPAGVYDVVAVRSFTGPPVTLGTAKLVVRDVITLKVDPPAGPVDGGTQLTITSPRPYQSFDPLHITIGGTPVNAYARLNDFTLVLTTPPHAAGPVDVQIESVSAGVQLATAVFTYYDPHDATPDPFVFTSILFPLDYSGPGAFGTDWRTENVMETPDGKTKLPVTSSLSGVVVPFVRGTTVYANSRIRDVSRSAQSGGTEIPLVRENDFRDHLRLLNVPTGKNFRALLRVWTIGEPVDKFYVNIDQIPTLVAMTAALTPGQGGLRYGTFDLTPFLDPGNDHLDISAGIFNPAARIWGMISITNNDTQQVTIVSPQ